VSPVTGATPGARWLRTLGPAPGARTRLVCFPHAGGAASFFRDWPRRLGADTKVLAVRYPGREDRIADPLAGRMEELAAPIAEAVAPLLDRPVVFFGHSMGASVAYEVALRLADAGRGLARLMVSGRAAPHRLDPAGRGLREDGELIADVRRRGGPLAQALDEPDLLELILPSIRADYRLLDDYAPRAVLRPLDTEVTAYYGVDDPDVLPESVLAWREVSPERFRARGFHGGHFYLVSHAAGLLGDIAAGLRPAAAHRSAFH
jgi:surfactin synthase thioesterase subunit